MTGEVIGMRHVNSSDLSITTGNICHPDIDRSIAEKRSDDVCFVTSPGLDKKEFEMESSSRASSRTSTTEPVEDVGDAEEEDSEVEETDDNNYSNENCSISAPSDSITKEEALPEPSESERKEPIDSENERQLRFSTITIREYPVLLGDNVTVKGPPISIDWEHMDENVYELEDYEEACRDTRRAQVELKMPSKHRDDLLREIGYSRQEIQEAVKKSNITRNKRKRTVETLKLQPLHEAFEKMVKLGKKPLGRKTKSNPKMDRRKTF